MLGKLQRRVYRAFIAKPGETLTTADLIALCFPRQQRITRHCQRFSVRRAAERVAVKVGRTYPGGFIWQAKAEGISAKDPKIPK